MTTQASDSSPSAESPLQTFSVIVGTMGGVFALLAIFLPTSLIQPVGALVVGLGITAYLVSRGKWDWGKALATWGATATLLTIAYLLIARPATVIGSVIDPNGDPVSGLAITLTDSSGVAHNAITDEVGTFEVRDVPGGRYTLTSSGDLLQSGEVASGYQRLFDVHERVPSALYQKPEPPPGPTTELAIIPSATIPPETSTPQPTVIPTTCPEGNVCEIFPQVAGTNAQPFTFTYEPGTLDNRFLPQCAHSGEFGLSLAYNYADLGNGGWGVHWASSPTGRFDASSFTTLTFWVQGETGGENFHVGLKDTAQNEIKANAGDYVVLPAGEWRPLSVPLTAFDGVNLQSIENVSFGFNKDHGRGSICVDDIAFTRP